MILVHHAAPGPAAHATIAVPVDRLNLSKRRWRAVAADGREFGFDLHHHLHNGDVVHKEDGIAYVLTQQPEPVLEIELPASPHDAARLAWQIGNLHFALEATATCIRVADDPALRQLFEREHIACTERIAVFQPFAHGHHH
jgi:urease accessory protein UreE